MSGQSRSSNSSRSRQFKPTDARGIAYSVLSQYREHGEFVAPQLDRACTAAKLSSQDRGLANELVSGVVRRKATLDAIIESCVSRPRHQVEAELWTLLQLGTYQLVLLSSVPPHAAVNETVQLANRIGKPRWTGMLNGVLRNIGRNMTAEEVTTPAANAVPFADGRYRQLAQPIFPDPATEFTEYVAHAFSYPRWLIDRWSHQFEPSEIVRLAFWQNAASLPCLRVNQIRTNREQVLKDLTAAGIDAVPGAFAESIRLNERTTINKLVGLPAGQYTLQDESAMSAVDLLDPQPDETILDLCAAPGTKSTHLAERMQDRGRIVAADVNEERLSRIRHNCERLGLSVVKPQLVDRDGRDIPQGPFDAILVDVPCSNTGVLSKRPEARWRLGPTDLRELPEIQQRLLDAAAQRLKPTGRLVYSTCSIEPEENRDVIFDFLEKNSALLLKEERQHIPGKPADGAYQALLQRNA